jgi:uncharacterized membrane protein YeaQ/YmgE (transglycosylase-associated protein family)
MHLSDQGLIVILVVGLLAGWLAGKVVRGSGFGLVGDAAIGIFGALIPRPAFAGRGFGSLFQAYLGVWSGILWLVRTGVSNGAIGCVRQPAHDNA